MKQKKKRRIYENQEQKIGENREVETRCTLQKR